MIPRLSYMFLICLVVLSFSVLKSALTSNFCSQEYKFALFDANTAFKKASSVPTLPSKPLSPHDSAEVKEKKKKIGSKESGNENREQRIICYVVCGGGRQLL